MNYHLVQLNIATLKEPLDSPLLADFVAKLDEINALADAAEGFVWRWIEEEEEGVKVFNNRMLIINMSVWEDVESLKNYTYKTAHAEVMRQRKKWMEHMKNAYYVLWWVPAGHIPSLEEAKEKLEFLRVNGPSAKAFDFKNTFEPKTQ